MHRIFLTRKISTACGRSVVHLFNNCPFRPSEPLRNGSSDDLLVKPQFESSREEADRGNGVIRDPRIWIRTLQEVAAQAEKEAAPIQGVAISPISGARGNREFFFYLRKGAEEKFVDIPAVISNVKGVSE